MTTQNRLAMSLIVFYLFVTSLWPIMLTRLALAASVEDVALLKSSNREKILVEGAKKEGKVNFYTGLIVDQVVRPVKDAFEKEYPFIQIEFFGVTPSVSRKKFWQSTRPKDTKST